MHNADFDKSSNSLIIWMKGCTKTTLKQNKALIKNIWSYTSPEILRPRFSSTRFDISWRLQMEIYWDFISCSLSVDFEVTMPQTVACVCRLHYDIYATNFFLHMFLLIYLSSARCSFRTNICHCHNLKMHIKHSCEMQKGISVQAALITYIKQEILSVLGYRGLFPLSALFGNNCRS